MTRLRLFSMLLVLGGAAACGERPAANPAPPPRADSALPAGEAYLAVPGGRIWYRLTGSGSGVPVILLHGGPGYSSYYLKSLEALGSDRPVVRYDQLGGGKSSPAGDTTLRSEEHTSELQSQFHI